MRISNLNMREFPSLKSHKAEHRHQHEIVPYLWSALKSGDTGHNDE